MKTKQLLSFLLLPCIALFIYACGGKHKPQSTEEIGKVFSGDGGKKMLHVDDATEINPAWSKENVMIVHIIGEPDQMHPANGNQEVRGFINFYTQKFILRYGLENCKATPDLAKELPQISADHLNYTYELRSEAKWDDNSPITVDDIIFSFKAYKCPLTNNPHAKPYLQNLVSIKKDDTNPLKFTLVMKQEYVQNLELVTDFPILQKSFFDAKNLLANYTLEQFGDKNFKADKEKNVVDWANEFNDAKYGHDVKYLVGAGPYRFESWEPGQKIVLVKKQNYWAKGSTRIDDQAYTDKIIFKLNKDQNATMLEFKNQTIDVSNFLSMKTLITLQQDSAFNANYNSRFISNFNYSYLGINTKPDGVKHQKLFTDKNVRRAIALLTPVDDMIAVVYKNKCKRVTSMVSPMKQEYNTDLTLIPYDVEKAKKILDDAGWKDSNGDGIRDKMVDGKLVQMTFDLNIMNSVVDWKDMAQMVVESFKKAGLQANISIMDPKSFVDKNKHHDFDLILGTWGMGSGADDFSQNWGTQNWTSNGSNYTGFGNAETDALIDSCRYIVDPAKRIPLVKKFQAIVYDEQPMVFLNAGTRRIAIHKRFGNANFYIERPSVSLNNLKLLSGEAAK